MSEAWLNFAAVLLSQALLFVACAIFYKKQLPEIRSILTRSIVIGLVVGLLFDLVLGKFLGLNTYALGFTLPFLFVNAVSSYGLFSATVLLARKAQSVHFLILTILIVGVYEVTNRFFSVWKWEFALPAPLFFAALLTGYLAGAFVVLMLDKAFRLKRSTL